MVNALILSIITAFVIIGAHIVTNWEGMLLHWVYRLYESIIDALTVKIDIDVDYVDSSSYHAETERLTDVGRFIQYIAKPIFTCPYCMSSVWTVAMWFAWGCGTSYVFLIPCILMTCGIVAVLWGAITYFKGE